MVSDATLLMKAFIEHPFDAHDQGYGHAAACRGCGAQFSRAEIGSPELWAAYLVHVLNASGVRIAIPLYGEEIAGGQAS